MVRGNLQGYINNEPDDYKINIGSCQELTVFSWMRGEILTNHACLEIDVAMKIPMGKTFFLHTSAGISEEMIQFVLCSLLMNAGLSHEIVVFFQEVVLSSLEFPS
jgi:hypothetical protein